MRTLKLSVAAGILSVATLLSCNKEEISGGSFNVRMTDSPGDYEALTVEITKVEAYSDTKGWVALGTGSRLINILELTNGAETQIAYQSGVEAGTYTRLKLSFGEENTITVSNNSTVTNPSAEASATFQLQWDGPKETIIEINEEVSGHQGAEVLLDFHVVESVSEQLNSYVIKPVITVIHDASTGVSGEIEGTVQAAIVLENDYNSYSTYADAGGKFLLRGVEEGLYDLLIIPQTDNGLPQTPKRIEGVVITRGQITQAGTINL